MLITHTRAAIDREDSKDEDELQALIFDRPEPLGGDDSRDLVSVKHELPTLAGRVDLLAISPSGVPTVVEVKLARRNVSDPRIEHLNLPVSSKNIKNRLGF